MKKDKVTMFAEESYNDLDDNIGIVMPILTDCDVDEDFTEGMEKVGEELPILPLRNMVLFPGVAMPVMIGRPKSMRLIKEAAHKKSLILNITLISFSFHKLQQSLFQIIHTFQHCGQNVLWYRILSPSA